MDRRPEPELMDLPDEARAYAAADFAAVNGAFVARLLELTGPLDPARALDLGTGPADIPVRLLARRPGSRVTGVDGSAAMLDIARAAVGAAGVAGAIDLRLGDAAATGLPAAWFDVVFSNSLLHHVGDPVGLWREIRRVARPGAVVFVRDLARPADEAAARRLVRLHAGGESDLLREEFFRSLLSAYTPAEVRRQLERAGFTSMTVAESATGTSTRSGSLVKHCPRSDGEQAPIRSRRPALPGLIGGLCPVYGTFDINADPATLAAHLAPAAFWSLGAGRASRMRLGHHGWPRKGLRAFGTGGGRLEIYNNAGEGFVGSSAGAWFRRAGFARGGRGPEPGRARRRRRRRQPRPPLRPALQGPAGRAGPGRRQHPGRQLPDPQRRPHQGGRAVRPGHRRRGLPAHLRPEKFANVEPRVEPTSRRASSFVRGDRAEADQVDQLLAATAPSPTRTSKTPSTLTSARPSTRFASRSARQIDEAVPRPELPLRPRRGRGRRPAAAGESFSTSSKGPRSASARSISSATTSSPTEGSGSRSRPPIHLHLPLRQVRPRAGGRGRGVGPQVLREKGFFDVPGGAEAQLLARPDGVAGHFVVDEGPRYVIDHVQFMGNATVTEGGAPQGAEAAGGPVLRPGRARSRRPRSGPTPTAASGYIYQPNATNPDYLRIDTKTVFLTGAGHRSTWCTTIHEGKPFRVGRIFVKGNDKSQDKLVLREFREFTPGELYNSGEVQDAIDRLRGIAVLPATSTMTPIGDDPNVPRRAGGGAGAADRSSTSARASTATAASAATSPTSSGTSTSPTSPRPGGHLLRARLHRRRPGVSGQLRAGHRSRPTRPAASASRTCSISLTASATRCTCATASASTTMDRRIGDHVTFGKRFDYDLTRPPSPSAARR